MSKMIMAQENGRAIGGPDKIFGISNLAKARIEEVGKSKVIDSTIGALLDDEGDLIVLSSVVDVLRSLAPADYAAYAPIAGIPSFLEAVKTAVFGEKAPEGFVEACFTPGGTGALRDAISCYTRRGDAILTSDWHWSPYKTIAAEQERTLETYPLFDERSRFNHRAFDQKVKEILGRQEELLVIINTPSHNPTGYTFTAEDWEHVIQTLKEAAPMECGQDAGSCGEACRSQDARSCGENADQDSKTASAKKVIVVVDIAYLDFSGDAKKYRAFFSQLSGLPQNILPLIAFSASKGFTLYGMRCGALLCLAPTAEIAAEFKAAAALASRGTWSNGNRAAMEVIARIFNDPGLLAKVTEEREIYLQLMQKRGKAFMDEAMAAGLPICPYDSGFFVTVPCENDDAVSKELQQYDIFAVPIGKGIRIAICAISEEKCKTIPEKVMAAIKSAKAKRAE